MSKTTKLDYIGRFAPSPTGPLHAGSLVAALASWLDAKAHGGQWLVRIEDVDTPRCVQGADQMILQQLAACGLHPDAPPVYQSQRGHAYQSALDQLIEQSQAYPCSCSRQAIQAALTASDLAVSDVSSGHHTAGKRRRHGELIYPGTCRSGLHGKQARSWRFLTDLRLSNRSFDKQVLARKDSFLIADSVSWDDRQSGPQAQNVALEVGDFVLRRADGLWAYQLAVVVDDAAQGITHIVRGQDLADNTARQILLQQALGLHEPQYLHTPLVLGANAEKLSKQNGAKSLNLKIPGAALVEAGDYLGISCTAINPAAWLQEAVNHWAARFKIRK